MKSVKILLTCLVTILVLSTLAYAEVPKMINYQGKLTTPQGALFNDTLAMTFSIYADSTGGTALWTETQTSVKVEYGVFSVLLGSVNPIPATVFDGNTRYLGLKVGSDNEMTPRKAIVSVGYAYHSITSDTAKFILNSNLVIDYGYEDNVSECGTSNVSFHITFSSPPVVIAGYKGDIDCDEHGNWSVYNITTSGFTLRNARPNNPAGRSAYWIAVGPRQ